MRKYCITGIMLQNYEGKIMKKCKNCEHDLSFHKSTMEDLPNTWQHYRGHGELNCDCKKPESEGI